MKLHIFPMSTLTLELDDSLAGEIARAARESRLSPDEWAKVQLASAVGAAVSAPRTRVLGLHEGEPYSMSEDFNATPDDFREYL